MLDPCRECFPFPFQRIDGRTVAGNGFCRILFVGLEVSTINKVVLGDGIIAHITVSSANQLGVDLSLLFLEMQVSY